MPLVAGVRLGIYEILELIGMGGMGEVYRARDPKLNRDVALKILPPMVAADPDRLTRFKREAQLLASLNHPNIAAIYGFEDSAGVQALILELVDGPTLADRIAQSRIPLQEALAIATQIADALEAAHERGIIHRDLKPGNIKVRPDGTVKVLDFGLAKALAADGATSDALESPTITSPALTRLGMILGTAAYMSPEQARGQEADRRSDIWAFGCVLYEMLAGKRAFDDSEVSNALASILTSDPDWSALPPSTPHAIRRVLRRSLEKDPRKRIRHIADVRLELDEPAAQDVDTSLPAGRSNRVRNRTAWALVAALLVLLAGVAAYIALKPTSALEVMRFQVYPPPNTVFGSPLRLVGRAVNVVVSPDGTRLVSVATDQAGKSQLWIQRFDSFDALPLTGTDGAVLPFWSPDSRWVGFFVGKKLMKVDAAGGSPQTICDVVGELLRGATWGSGGDIIFSSGNPPRLYRVSAQGSASEPLLTQVGQHVAADASWPHFLPDGRTFLFWTQNTSAGPTVFIASVMPGNTPRSLVSSETAAVYDPSGFLLFTRRGAILRQRFDTSRMDVSGDTRTVAERVAMTAGSLSVSTNGVLAYQPETGLTSQFAWFDRSGRLLETIGAPGSYRAPQLSPDGGRLLYENLADGNLWVLDMSRRMPAKFTTGAGVKISPVWSPDGAAIFYEKRTEDGGPAAIFEKSASGAMEEKLFFQGPTTNGPAQISRDGKWLLYFVNPEGEVLGDIYALPMTGDRQPQRIVQSPFSDVEPQLSPDAGFVAYVSTETGQSEIYVQPFPATGERWPISNTGGRQPLWRQDGKELFFVSPDSSRLYAVEIEIKPGSKLEYGPPTFLFELRANVLFVRNSYIPSPDGQRFLVNMALDTSTPPIRVVRNWTAGLED